MHGNRPSSFSVVVGEWTSEERRHIEAVKKRCKWLDSRIVTAHQQGRLLTHDVAELKGLQWLLSMINEPVEVASTQGNRIVSNTRLYEQTA